MALPPLRTGSALIGSRRYPAIVGETEGRCEIFVCGLHIDRFLSRFFPAVESAVQQGIRIDVERDGRQL